MKIVNENRACSPVIHTFRDGYMLPAQKQRRDSRANIRIVLQPHSLGARPLLTPLLAPILIVASGLVFDENHLEIVATRKDCFPGLDSAGGLPHHTRLPSLFNVFDMELYGFFKENRRSQHLHNSFLGRLYKSNMHCQHVRYNDLAVSGLDLRTCLHVA